MPQLHIVAVSPRYVAPSLWDAPPAMPVATSAATVEVATPAPGAPILLAAARAAKAAGPAAPHASASPAPPAPKEAPWPPADRAPLVWGQWPSADARLAVVGDPARRVWAYVDTMECGAERPGVKLVLWTERADRLAEHRWVEAPRVRYLDLSESEQKVARTARAAKATKRKKG